MSKQFSGLLFIVFLKLNVPAQDIDSLRHAAGRLAHDTDRVNLFYKAGFAYRSSDPQYSYDCAREAERYAQQASQPYYAAKAFNLLGILYYRRGDLSRAVSYHKKALELRSLINDRQGIALSQTNLGNAFSDMGLYRQAETAYLKALELNTDLGQQKQAGNCLLNLGALFAELKKPQVAENYFNLALANARLRFDYELEANCYNNLAEINALSGNYDAAIANCMNSLKIKALMDQGMEMADTYLTLGKVYLYKQEPTQGKIYLHLADSIITEFNYLGAMLQSLQLHADYFAQEKNMEQAYRQLKRYQDLKDSLGQEEKESGMTAGFVEGLPAPKKTKEGKHEFPYLYFWILFVTTAGGGIFIYRFKR